MPANDRWDFIRCVKVKHLILLIAASSVASFNILKVSLTALSNLKQTFSAHLFFKVSRHFLKDRYCSENNTVSLNKALLHRDEWCNF